MTYKKDVKRIVFKVGTSTLTYDTGRINIRRLSTLAQVLSDVKNSGIEVVLVTSGAIGVGVGKLGLGERPKDTPGRQAAATVGQCELMFLYDKFFGEYGNAVGQLLVTRDDFEDGEKRWNLQNAFTKLFEYGALPIVNENDAVAVEEIVFGDNDALSAHVAKLVEADRLIILTDTDGLFNADPAENKNAVLIKRVEEITDELLRVAGGAGTGRGVGGMSAKLRAARTATESGIDVAVINGAEPDNIYKLLNGEEIGTLFKAKRRKNK